MSYLENFTDKELRERFSQFPFEINDIIDLYNLFLNHNLFPSDSVIVYEDRLEVQDINYYHEEQGDVQMPYFELDYMNFYMPRKEGDESVFLVEFIDDYDADDHERYEVIEYLSEMLVNMIEVDKIHFKLSHD